MRQSHTPNLIEVLRATMQDVEQSSGVQEDDPSLLQLRTILNQRIANLERDLASEFSEAASKPAAGSIVEETDWEMAS